MSRYLPDLGYPHIGWAKGADREALLASARKSEPNWSDENIERLAKAGSQIDALFKRAVPHPRHGFAIVDSEAA